MLILIPGCRFAELAHGNKRKNKRLEGCFKFSIRISLLELVYNTERLCYYWLCAEFFNVSWLLFSCSESEETYSACIIAGGIYSKPCSMRIILPLTAISVSCSSCFITTASAHPPRWVLVQVEGAVGGVVRLGTTSTWVTAYWRESKEEWKGLSSLFRCSCLFWSVRRGNEGTVCDFISFHSGKGEVSVIPDSWSWEHKRGLSFLHQAHTYQFIDFPCVRLRVLWDKSQELGFFPLCSHSRLFYSWRQHGFILLRLSLPTKVTPFFLTFTQLHSYL